jgi:hypothetical protein
MNADEAMNEDPLSDEAFREWMRKDLTLMDTDDCAKAWQEARRRALEMFGSDAEAIVEAHQRKDAEIIELKEAFDSIAEKLCERETTIRQLEAKWAKKNRWAAFSDEELEELYIALFLDGNEAPIFVEIQTELERRKGS